MCALTAEARRLEKRVAAHVHDTPGVLTSIAARVTTIEHCSFLHPSGVQYTPEQGRRIADAGIYVCPTVFQGLGKLFVQDPNQPWAAAHRARQAVRFDRVRRLVEQGVQLVSGSDAGVSTPLPIIPVTSSSRPKGWASRQCMCSNRRRRWPRKRWDARISASLPLDVHFINPIPGYLGQDTG